MRLRLFLRAIVAATVISVLSGCESGFLIDASEQGGEAFVAFTVMVVLFTVSLFAMDRIRRRNDEHNKLD